MEKILRNLQTTVFVIDLQLCATFCQRVWSRLWEVPLHNYGSFWPIFALLFSPLQGQFSLEIVELMAVCSLIEKSNWIICQIQMNNFEVEHWRKLLFRKEQIYSENLPATVAALMQTDYFAKQLSVSFGRTSTRPLTFHH